MNLPPLARDQENPLVAGEGDACLAASAAGGAPTLSSKAALTVLSNILTMVVAAVVQFFVTPLLTSGLGTERYGAWSVIQRMTAFMGLTNLNAIGGLKLRLGTTQHSTNYAEKRRHIGAALVVWALLLPVAAVATTILVVASTKLIPVAASAAGSVRSAVVVMCVGSVIGMALSVPGATLRAQNQEYRAMGLSAISAIVGGCLVGLAAASTGSLVAVAGAAVAGSLLFSLVRALVALRILPWLGVERPPWALVADHARLSGWVSVTALGGVALTSADLVLASALAGPAAAAVYATSGAAARLGVGPLQQALSAGNAGIADLSGRRMSGRLIQIRAEQHSVALFLMSVLTVTIVCTNRSFLAAWVGPQYFGGRLLTLFLCLAAGSQLFVNTESVFLDAVLKLERKAALLLIAAAGGGLLASVCVRKWGLVGVAGAWLAVSAAVAACLFVAVSRLLGEPLWTAVTKRVRTVLVSGLLISAATVVQPRLPLGGWIPTVLTALTTSAVAAAIMFRVGLDRGPRLALRRRAVGALSSVTQYFR